MAAADDEFDGVDVQPRLTLEMLQPTMFHACM